MHYQTYNPWPRSSEVCTCSLIRLSKLYCLFSTVENYAIVCGQVIDFHYSALLPPHLLLNFEKLDLCLMYNSEKYKNATLSPNKFAKAMSAATFTTDQATISLFSTSYYRKACTCHIGQTIDTMIPSSSTATNVVTDGCLRHPSSDLSLGSYIRAIHILTMIYIHVYISYIPLKPCILQR